MVVVELVLEDCTIGAEEQSMTSIEVLSHIPRNNIELVSFLRDTRRIVPLVEVCSADEVRNTSGTWVLFRTWHTIAMGLPPGSALSRNIRKW